MGLEQNELDAINVPRAVESLSIVAEFEWMESLIHFRIRELCEDELLDGLPKVPELVAGVHPYFDELIEKKVTMIERIALALAFIAQSAPQYLDYLYTKNKYTDQLFSEFGLQHPGHNGLVPTWKTAFFLYSGNETREHFELIHHIRTDARLYLERMLVMHTENGGNAFHTQLRLSKELLHAWSYPAKYPMKADPDFPADEISSPLEWSDLFINDHTRTALHELRLWLRHEKDMRKHPKMGKHLNLGMRVLFFGPSGTGKTLTASLLGKEFNMPVYRVDLSQMVSKWIGETEKNLARVFDIAERKKWMLFFDEADSLFSKRGAVNSSNDRHANQQVSYLLQRVENYDGTIIMATNLKDNIDEAFARRFQLIVEFPMPDAATRLAMWTQILADTFPLSADVNLTLIARDFELTGGAMKNIFRSLMLRIYDRPESERTITSNDLHVVIQQELIKTGMYIIRKNY